MTLNRFRFFLLALSFTCELAAQPVPIPIALETNRFADLYCGQTSASVSVDLWNALQYTQAPTATSVITMVFSAPIQQLGLLTDGAQWAGYSGQTAQFILPAGTQIPAGKSIQAGVYLDLSQAKPMTPVSVTVMDTPFAIVFGGLGPTFVLGLVDPSACSGTAAGVVTLDDFNASCPSKQEIDSMNQDLTLSFESDPSAGTLVCHVADGSADLTLLQERTYQALRIMRAAPFDTPLPWVATSLYDWFITSVKGIRFLNYSDPRIQCCDSNWMILVPVSPGLSILGSKTNPKSLAEFVVTLVHEARHGINGVAHDCNITRDQTLSEMGAWAAHVYAAEWMALHTGAFLVPRNSGPFPASYRIQLLNGSWSSLNVDLCDKEGGVGVTPRKLTFSSSVGSFSAPRAIAVTLTAGAPQKIDQVFVSGYASPLFPFVADHCSGATVPPSCTVVLHYMSTGMDMNTAVLNVVIGGQTKTVSLVGFQTACGYSLSSYSKFYGSEKAADSVTVTKGSACKFSTKSDAGWVKVDPINMLKPMNSIPLSFKVAPNTAKAVRQATITLTGSSGSPTMHFTITQAPAK